ncbi:hypothetical protein Tco_1354711 [Tanacetum coccineum]
MKINCCFLTSGQNNVVDEDVDEQPVHDLALNVDNMFQADDCDAFDSDVDEASTAQTMFMANLSSTDPVMMKPVRLMIRTFYLSAVLVVQSNVSSVPNDAYMMMLNDIYEPSAKCVSITTQNNIIDNSLTAELATYKEQVELYERRAKFELTEREQKINEQLRIVITDRHIKEEILKKELHSVKMQLTSTVNHNKSMVEEVTSLKKDFKQKENKYLEDFLDMKALKEKVKDKLYKQDQSLQIVHMLCKPKPYYDEQNKCVKKKVKIAPPDYSKENYLATFTPQKQLTPEQIFWSNDLIKMKAEALKKQTTASRPIKALTMYPPNTPATLVPRVLPTKSQVKINIFTLIQLFLEFEKTCKKRITPTGLTEGERGFEQTKECYLTEVIPFFKTLKEHFEGIQKALTKEIKEMKDIFEELEAEVDQNVVNRKHDEIERKNLLIANDNLIADFFSKEVFYVATNSKLNVSRFTEMHDAHTIVEARSLELEAELYKLHDKISQLTEKVNSLQDQNELFRAENAKIKQHYKELYDSIKITRAKHTEQTNALKNENESLKVQIQNTVSCVTTTQFKPKVTAPGKYALDVAPISPRNRNNREVHLVYLRHLKESVDTLREIVEEAKVERPLDRSLAFACRYTKHSQELLEYAFGTCPKVFNQQDKKHANTPRKKQVTFADQCATSSSTTHNHVEPMHTQKSNVPVPPSTGVNSCTVASGSQPRSILKKHRIPPAKSDSLEKVEDHSRTIRSSCKTTNRVDSSISSKRTVINSNSHSVCQTCNKCLFSANHDMCVVTYLHSVNASPKVKNAVRHVKQVWKPKQVTHVGKPKHIKQVWKPKQIWKPTGKTLNHVGHQWRPTGRTFTLSDKCPLTRFTKLTGLSATACANQSEPNQHWGSNFPNSPSSSVFKCRNFVKKFIGTVRFGNDHFGAIMGYGDYVIGDSVISRVYYVEGLGHNLFSVGQFCDSDLEVAFRKHSCYVRDTDGARTLPMPGSIIREVFVKLLLDSFGKLSIRPKYKLQLVSFMRILRLREVARATARIALEFAPDMSPPIRRKYHNSVAFATGCKRIKKSKRCNRKIRIPIAMWPCRVEEKMTLKEVDGQTVEEIETKIIAKDGTITRVPGQFQGYETSKEEPVEQPRRHDLYGFVDHPQLQQGNPMNEFAPHRLPQPKGNMNGWLIEDEEEVERNEVDSDLESTASSKPMWKKTNKADHDRASRNCPWCSK